MCDRIKAVAAIRVMGIQTFDKNDGIARATIAHLQRSDRRYVRSPGPGQRDKVSAHCVEEAGGGEIGLWPAAGFPDLDILQAAGGPLS
jgi:hypothetical protein